MPAAQDSRPTAIDRDGLVTHLGTVSVVVSAVGYAVGYVFVWLYAVGLGVSPRDLGLGPSDHLLLAGLWVLFFAVYGLAGWAAQATNVQLPVAVAVQSVALILMFVPVPPPATMVTIGLLVLLFGGLLMWTRSSRALIQAPSLVGRSVLFVGLLGVLGLAAYITWWWGNEVGSHPDRVGTRGPPALSLVLPATEGFVTPPDGEPTCVLRVASDVVVDGDGVQVGADELAFAPASCTP